MKFVVKVDSHVGYVTWSSVCSPSLPSQILCNPSVIFSKLWLPGGSFSTHLPMICYTEMDLMTPQPWLIWLGGDFITLSVFIYFCHFPFQPQTFDPETQPTNTGWSIIIKIKKSQTEVTAVGYTQVLLRIMYVRLSESDVSHDKRICSRAQPLFMACLSQILISISDSWVHFLV